MPPSAIARAQPRRHVPRLAVADGGLGLLASGKPPACHRALARAVRARARACRGTGHCRQAACGRALWRAQAHVRMVARTLAGRRRGAWRIARAAARPAAAPLVIAGAHRECALLGEVSCKFLSFWQLLETFELQRQTFDSNFVMLREFDQRLANGIYFEGKLQRHKGPVKGMPKASAASLPSEATIIVPRLPAPTSATRGPHRAHKTVARCMHLNKRPIGVRNIHSLWRSGSVPGP